MADLSPPQEHPKGQRRALDAQWLAYLAHGGDPGAGHALTPLDAYRTAIAQFNDARYFEAHETFEHIWLATPYPDRLLALALSKLGAAFEHAKRGNRPGAAKIARAALTCLAPLPDEYADIDVRALEAAVALGLRSSGGPAPRIISALW